MIAEMESHQLVNQSSGECNYFTPSNIIEAARSAMFSITLDPASCEQANKIVKAAIYYTESDDGLSKPWGGHVWMNHPFSKGWKACDANCKRKTCRDRGFHVNKDIPGNEEWINKLVSEFVAGEIDRACCITYAATSEAWFKPLMNYAQCFLFGRTNYVLPDGTVKNGVTKGSVVTYLGPNINKFAQSFKHLGAVKIPYHY